MALPYATVLCPSDEAADVPGERWKEFLSRSIDDGVHVACWRCTHAQGNGNGQLSLCIRFDWSEQTTEDGYDYSIYDKSYNLLDGGVYDDPDISIHEAIELIIEDDPISGISALSERQNATLIDYEELTAKADEAWQESIHSPLPEPPAEEHSYPLPDAGVSIADRNAYGYLNDEMLPLSQERATELFEQDLTVYMFFEDDTEAMAFDREDIDNHSGLFGIEKNDWTALQDYEDLKGDGRLSPEIQEQLFFESTKDAFAIYQLKSGEEYRGIVALKGWSVYKMLDLR